MPLVVFNQGMAEFLEEALERCPAQRKTQLQYIVHQLNQEPSAAGEEGGEEPDDSGDEAQEDDEDDEV